MCRAMETFIANLKIAMRLKGMTQVQLADAIGTSQPNISRIFRGGESLTIDRAERIADAVGMPLENLISKNLKKLESVG